MIRFFTPLDLILAVLLLLACLAGLLLVPAGAMLPTHWGASGEPDMFLPRNQALLMPILVTAGVWLVYFTSARMGRRRNGLLLTAVTAIFLLLEVLTVLIGVGVAVNMVQTIALGLGLLLVVLGNALPQAQPVGGVGIRVPATLHDPLNWQATHRVTGRLFVLGGLVLMVAALTVAADQLIWWLLGCAIVPAGLGFLYAVTLDRRRRR